MTDQIAQLRAALTDALAVIDGLADQQAMDDLWYVTPRDRIAAVLDATAPAPVDYYQGTPEAPHLNFARAETTIADGALAFARYLANEQGAADNGSLNALFAEARKQFEARYEEEFA